MWFISDAAAQQAGQAAPNMMSSFFMIGIFVVIFYFMIIRPQSKRAKEHKNLIEGLGKGDEVVTSGGMMGKITVIDEQFVKITVAENIDIAVQKQAIVSTLPKGTIKSIKS